MSNPFKLTKLCYHFTMGDERAPELHRNYQLVMNKESKRVRLFVQVPNTNQWNEVKSTVLEKDTPMILEGMQEQMEKQKFESNLSSLMVLIMMEKIV